MRTELGFTIHHIAVALLVTPDMVQRLENDDFKEIPRGWLAKLSSLSGLETSQIVEQTNIRYYDPGRQIYVLGPKV